MRHLRAVLPVVEDVDGVERHLRVEELRPHGRVAADGRVQVRVLAGRLVEQERSLDRVRVGLERLQLVVLPVRLLVADLGAGAERVHVLAVDERERHRAPSRARAGR